MEPTTTWQMDGPLAAQPGLPSPLGSNAAGRLGLCLASGFDRVSVDTSKDGSRGFCSTTCQNRIKAAAYRARR